MILSVLHIKFGGLQGYGLLPGGLFLACFLFQSSANATKCSSPEDSPEDSKRGDLPPLHLPSSGKEIDSYEIYTYMSANMRGGQEKEGTSARAEGYIFCPPNT